MKKTISIILFLAWFSASVAMAQTAANSLSLKQAIQYSMQENTDVKKQNLAIIQSEYRTKETWSAAMPQISGSAQFTDNVIIPTSMLPGEIFGQPGVFLPVKFGVQYGILLSARLDQVIYNQALFTALKQSKAAAELSNIQQERTEQDVIYNVASAYYQSIIVLEQQKIVEANMTKLKQSVNVAQVQFDNQMIRKIDLDQLKVNLVNTQSDLDNSIQAYAQSVDLLKILIGYPLTDTLILSDNVEDKSFEVPLNTVDANPILSLIDKQSELKKIEISGINARYFPTVSGFGSIGYQTQFNEFTKEQMQWTGISAIGVSVNIPIFDGLQKLRQVQQRQIELKSISLDKSLAHKQLNFQYNNALRKYHQTVKTANNQKSNYDLAQSVYEAVQINYKNGLASLSDLINADSGLKGAQTQYLTALLQKKISALDILRANGNMNELLNK